MKIKNTLAMWIFIALVLVVPLACKHVGSLSSNSNSEGGSSGGSTAKSSPFQRPLQLTGPRTLSYANLQFTLGSGNSSATVAGNLALAGNLYIAAASGFGPGTYTLINYSGALNLGNVAIASAPAGYNYTLNTSTAGKVQLIVAGLKFNSVSNTGGQLVTSGSGGPTNGTYYVLGSTNAALSLNFWTRIATNQFDSNGNFSFTNSINPNAPRQFYLIQLP
jgi:hypothetical protein